MLFNLMQLSTVFFLVLLFQISTFSLVCGNLCDLKSSDTHFKKYCCECYQKTQGGACLSTHSGTCDDYGKKVDNDLSCDRGYWGCYTCTGRNC